MSLCFNYYRFMRKSVICSFHCLIILFLLCCSADSARHSTSLKSHSLNSSPLSQQRSSNVVSVSHSSYSSDLVAVPPQEDNSLSKIFSFLSLSSLSRTDTTTSDTTTSSTTASSSNSESSSQYRLRSTYDSHTTSTVKTVNVSNNSQVSSDLSSGKSSSKVSSFLLVILMGLLSAGLLVIHDFFKIIEKIGVAISTAINFITSATTTIVNGFTSILNKVGIHVPAISIPSVNLGKSIAKLSSMISSGMTSAVKGMLAVASAILWVMKMFAGVLMKLLGAIFSAIGSIASKIAHAVASHIGSIALFALLGVIGAAAIAGLSALGLASLASVLSKKTASKTITFGMGNALTCEQDFSQMCPNAWETYDTTAATSSTQNQIILASMPTMNAAMLPGVQDSTSFTNKYVCIAPALYDGSCPTRMQWGILTVAEKKKKAAKCDVQFPCITEDTCTRDYTQQCPLNWAKLDASYCMPPTGYSQPCQNVKYALGLFSASAKMLFEDTCNAKYPCVESSKIVVTKVTKISYKAQCPYYWKNLMKVSGLCMKPNNVEYQPSTKGSTTTTSSSSSSAIVTVSNDANELKGNAQAKSSVNETDLLCNIKMRDFDTMSLTERETFSTTCNERYPANGECIPDWDAPCPKGYLYTKSIKMCQRMGTNAYDNQKPDSCQQNYVYFPNFNQKVAFSKLCEVDWTCMDITQTVTVKKSEQFVNPPKPPFAKTPAIERYIKNDF